MSFQLTLKKVSLSFSQQAQEFMKMKKTDVGSILNST